VTSNVSVIIPTYNRPHFLVQVLPSYLTQSHVAEVIVVDDGSMPSLANALPKETLDAPRLRVVSHRRSLGLCMARNTGLDHATSNFVFFGEDDLILQPDHVATLLDERERLSADIICGRLLHQMDSETLKEAIERTNHQTGSIFDRLHISVLTEHLREACELPFAHAIFLGPRDLLAEYRFSGRLGGPSFLREDGEMQLRLRKEGWRLFATPRTNSLHLKRSKTSDSGTRSTSSVLAQVASSALNSWQVIDAYYDEIAPFFAGLSRQEMARRVVVSAVAVGLKRHARASSTVLDSIITRLRTLT
jgi:glycosyltransferase involved in cell wall biosynthesis